MAHRAREWKRFKVVKELGSGGFGKTLLAADATRGDREVVIKIPHDKEKEKALINELINASALSANNVVGLSHPNIVRCLGFDLYEGYYVMIMEYVKGSDLRKMIGPAEFNRDPMDIHTALHYLKHACSGLAEAHRINLLHRDIKPDNIIVREEDDVAKLLDFGISTLVQSKSINDEVICGTLAYMAPEAWIGRANRLSDIWSLMVTAYELFTGRLPFWDENPLELKRKVDREDPIEPRKLNPNIDTRLSDLTMKGLQKDASSRFQSVQEMLNAFFPIDTEIGTLRAMFIGGKEAEAEAQARKLLRGLPREVGLYMLIGEFRNRQQQYSHAEEILREGIQIDPNHAGLHFYLAPALFSQGATKKEEAIVEIQKALRLGLGGSQKDQAERLLKSWSRR